MLSSAPPTHSPPTQSQPGLPTLVRPPANATLPARLPSTLRPASSTRPCAQAFSPRTAGVRACPWLPRASWPKKSAPHAFSPLTDNLELYMSNTKGAVVAAYALQRTGSTLTLSLLHQAFGWMNYIGTASCSNTKNTGSCRPVLGIIRVKRRNVQQGEQTGRPPGRPPEG